MVALLGVVVAHWWKLWWLFVNLQSWVRIRRSSQLTANCHAVLTWAIIWDGASLLAVLWGAAVEEKRSYTGPPKTINKNKIKILGALGLSYRCQGKEDDKALCVSCHQPNHTRHHGQLVHVSGCVGYLCLPLWKNVAQVDILSFITSFLPAPDACQIICTKNTFSF